MDSFLEPATLIKNELFLRYFSRILLNVLKGFFHRTPPSLFVVIKSLKFPNHVFLKTMSKMTFKKVKLVSIKASFQHADFSASAVFCACAGFSAYHDMNFHHNVDC